MTSPPQCRPYRIQASIKDFEVPVHKYLHQHPEISDILSAAILIHKNRVLLVQRAADDDFPNLWEVPGGTADRGETIVQCAVRELDEEVGLAAPTVAAMVSEYGWTASDSGGSDSQEWGVWKVFCFLVMIDGANEELDLEIKLDAREHQAYLWATETDVRGGFYGDTSLNWISSNQPQAILAAFESARSSGC
ncbi:NUDIX hydrolase domain-like protein [Lipomyces doorenjongii]